MSAIRYPGGDGSTGGSYSDEQVDDRVAALIVAGANMTATYNDGAGTLTLDAATSGASGIPASIVNAKGDLIAATADDTVARLAVGSDGLALTASSGAATGLAWAAPAPADASVTDAKVATGAAINADKTADGTTNKVYTATEKTKLAGIATAATANSSDATLLARANHTGTQAAGTITGLAALATSGSATDLGSGTVPTARLGSGTASSSTFLRGDQTWATPAGGSGTATVQLDPAGGMLRSSGFPALVQANGTNIPVRGLAFDASTQEAVFLRFRAAGYGSGNLAVALDWYADTASSGAVVWGAAIAALTPSTDTQDVETDSLATAATTTTTHLGTTGQRLHRTSVTVSSLDSLAADDNVALQVYRDAASGSDTMTGDCVLISVSVSYSTT